jgi:mycoredoxin
MNHSVNGNSPQITMYTNNWCGDCWRAKRIMESMKVEFVEVNISHDPDATAVVERLNNGNRSVPTILFPDGTVLTEPSTTELAGKISRLAR